MPNARNGHITAIIVVELLWKQLKQLYSSTFWTERIGPAAALKTLEVMEK